MGLTEKTYSQGEVIIKEGDIGKSFFRILDGKAGVYADYGKSDPFRIAVLEKGEYFGEMAIIEESPRSATVVAIGSVKVVEIPGNELDAYFNDNPDQIIELMAHLGSRVQAMTNDLNDAKALLKQVTESDNAKKKSLFAKIKRHIDMYQSNKNKMGEPEEDPRNEAFEALKNNKTGRTEAFTKGKIFYKEGEVSTCLYILKYGKVGVYNNFRLGDEEKLSELEAIDVFGSMGMIAEGARTETVIAESDDCVVEMVYREDLEQLFRTCPAKIDLIFHHLSNTLRRTTIDFLTACKKITETCN